jgi:hypothetical protein
LCSSFSSGCKFLLFIVRICEDGEISQSKIQIRSEIEVKVEVENEIDLDVLILQAITIIKHSMICAKA